MIKFCEPFDKSWTLHRIEIRGSADSYAEAETKLKKLDHLSYAYSTESETSAKKLAEHDTRKFKHRVSKRNLATVVEEFETARVDLNEPISSDDFSVDPGIRFGSSRSPSVPATTGSSLQNHSNITKSPALEDDISPLVPRNRGRRVLVDDGSSSELEDEVAWREQVRKDRAQRRMEKLNKFSRDKSTTETSCIKIHSSADKTKTSQEINNNSKSVQQSKKTSTSSQLLEEPSILRNPIVLPAKQSTNDKPPTAFGNQNGHRTGSAGIPKSSKTGANEFTTLDDSPDSTVDNNTHYSSLCRLINKVHISLSVQLARIKGDLIEMKNFCINIQRRNGTANEDVESEAEEDKLALPCQSMFEFKAFNAKLNVDKIYRTKIKLRVKSQITKKDRATKNVTDILKLFMNRQVGMRFTAVKKTNGKELFNETSLYKLLEGILVGSREDITTSKEFSQVVGRVFNNVKDWEGHRFLRQQNSVKKQKTTPSEAGSYQEPLLAVGPTRKNDDVDRESDREIDS
ncbi:uncharacterized protein [Fopius arisanus]|nr:PREDICTED: uncharacterized protein LOC105273080 [Fopius arisanus]